MATNLYETLGISKTATPEQVRKAYKKRALETHPDRLGPGISSADKAQSEELFRKVNNAYEVLRDPQNRRIYDQHGVWPPPEPASTPHRNANDGYPAHGQYYYGSRNNFYDPWGGNHPSFMFTDPFALFDSIFDDILPLHGSHYRRHYHERPWFATEISRLMDDDFGFPHHGSGGFMDFPFGRSMLPAPPSFFGVNNGGQWQAESFVSTTVNGVTQSSHRRRNLNGDEHITHTYADGRKVHKVNGVEQASGHEPPMIEDRPYRADGGHHEHRRDEVAPRDPQRWWRW